MTFALSNVSACKLKARGTGQFSGRTGEAGEMYCSVKLDSDSQRSRGANSLRAGPLQGEAITYRASKRFVPFL